MATAPYVKQGSIFNMRIFAGGIAPRSSENDAGRDVGVDAEGNVYVTGRSYGRRTNSDYVTIKYSPSDGEGTPPANEQAFEHANENSAVQQGIPANDKAKENANENAAFKR